MGGRGSSSGKGKKSGGGSQPQKKSLFGGKSTNKPVEKQEYKYTSSKKVQGNYINTMKQQMGIDLNKARDTQFDNKNGFNIDTRKLSTNELNSVKDWARRYDSYKVSFEDNGANRIYIRVSEKRPVTKKKPKK